MIGLEKELENLRSDTEGIRESLADKNMIIRRLESQLDAQDAQIAQQTEQL